MAKQKLSAKELQEYIDRANAAANRNIELLKEENDRLSNIFDMRRKIANQEEIVNQERIKQQNIVDILNKYEKEGYKIHGNKIKNLKKERDELNILLKKDEKRLANQKSLLAMVDATKKSFLSTNGAMRTFLMQSDAAIKSLNLELGLSGERAQILRESFEDSAGFAARMGVSVADLGRMQSIYAEETGRARMHNEANLEAMTLIAKGTNLGIEGAAQLAAQYEMMGFNATDTALEVQRIVDTTERMGVNTSKVLKAVNRNFKSLQKFTFKGGSQGIADMAIYSEKFKINMNEVMDSLQKGRALDSVIEMSAQLQVLGGQFANLSDPMAMLFESRNDPAAYTKRINEMTKGMVTMNKTAEGFELQIASPMAQDQLKRAAEALGMTTDELTQQAYRMREIQQTRSQMFAKGFTSEEKEIIESIAKFDKKTGRMMVDIGGVATDVSNLTTDQIDMLKEQQASLEARAEASQTFDQALNNTIQELKSALLPMLQGINQILETVRPVFKAIGDFANNNDWAKPLLGGAGMLMGASILLGKVITPLGMVAKTLTSGISKIIPSIKGGDAKNVSNKGTNVGKSAVGKGGGMLGKAGGFGTGAGLGVAALGAGAGVMLAAKGLSELADSMKELDSTQIWALPATMLAMSVGAFAAAPAITALGASSTVGAAGLLALGAAALMVGAGIGAAAAGIGYMAEGFSELDGVDLSKIGDGMMKFAGASALIGGLGLVGLGASALAIDSIASNADDIERIGNSFYNIGAVLKGDTSQFDKIKETIESIASIDVSENSGFAKIAELFSKPLKVEFTEQDVAFTANIDLRMGDSNFITEISKRIPARIVDLQQGKS